MNAARIRRLPPDPPQAACPDLFDGANSTGEWLVNKRDKLVSTADVFGQFDERLLTIVRSVWPKKTAHYLALVGDITVRQACRILAREQGASGVVIRRLMMTPHGERVLWAIMEGTKNIEWWDEYSLGKKLASIQKREAALKREKKILEGAL